jgi:hypothetical protein
MGGKLGTLFAVLNARDTEPPPDLLDCGDDEEATLVVKVAYEGDDGPAVAYRFEWREEEEA